MKIRNKKMIVAALSLTFLLAACSGQTEQSQSTSTSEESSVGNQAEDFDISIVSREDGSGTRGAFIELTGLEEEGADGQTSDMTSEDSIVQNSTNAVMQTVSQDPTSIGYISLGSLNDTVKAIKVDGVEATEENIKSGEYTLQRPFNLAYNKGELGDVEKDFLAYCLSADAQKIVEEEGYISVEAKGYETTSPSGKITVAGSTSVTPVMEKLIEAYKSVNPNASIDLQSTGSGAGIESTISKVSQIAMASRELKDEEKEQLESEVLAQDGIAVIVNKENTRIENVTMEQLRDIFAGKTTNTSEL